MANGAMLQGDYRERSAQTHLCNVTALVVLIAKEKSCSFIIALQCHSTLRPAWSSIKKIVGDVVVIRRRALLWWPAHGTHPSTSSTTLLIPRRRRHWCPPSIPPRLFLSLPPFTLLCQRSLRILPLPACLPVPPITHCIAHWQPPQYRRRPKDPTHIRSPAQVEGMR